MAVLDSAQGSAGTQVAAHELVGLALHELVDGAPDEAVAGAVGAVLADVVLLDHVAGQGVAPGALGHVVVERGIGDDDVAQLGEHVAADLDDVGLGIVVQRGQRSDLADPGQGLVGDHGGLGEVPAALDDAMANALDGSVNGLENLEHVLDGGAVIGQGDLQGRLAGALLLVANEGTVDADALAVALGKDLTGLGVEKLVLQAGATSIDNENVHVSPIL